MKVTDISLDAESEKELRRPTEGVRKAIRKRAVVMLFGCLLVMPIGYFGILQLDRERLAEKGSTGLVEDTIRAPTTAMRSITYLTLSILLFGGPVLGGYNLLRLVVPRISNPVWNTDPKKAVEFYYANLFRSGSYKVASYQYLLQQARDEIGGYEGFVEEHHAPLSSGVVQELRDKHDTSKIRDFSIAEPEIRRTRAVHSDMEHYSIHWSIAPQPGFWRSMTEDPKKIVAAWHDENEGVHLKEECTVVRVGNTWMIASGRWTGVLVVGDGS